MENFKTIYKYLFTLILLFFSISILTGCKKGITVIGEDIPSTHSMENLKDEIIAKYPKPIRIDFVKDPYEVMVRKANQDLASSTGVYDVILQYNTALASYASNNYVYNLSELREKLCEFTTNGKFKFEDKLFKKTWEEVGYYRNNSSFGDREVPFGIPFSANTMFLVYNKNLFSDDKYKNAFYEEYKIELKPPEDWSTFKKIAKFFTNSSDKTWGLVMQGGVYWIYYEWTNFAFSRGGGVMDKRKTKGWQGDENTPLILSSKETLEATKFYLSLKPYDGSDDFFSMDAGKQVETMKKGNIAMCIMWSDVAYNLLKNTFDPGMFGFSPIPGDVSMLAGGSFYINNKSKNPIEAMQFILFTMEEEIQSKLMLLGLCSPIRSVYKNPEVREKIPYTDALFNSLERGVYMLEAGPESDAIIVTISEMLQKLWRKGEDANILGALESAEEDIKSKRRRIYEQIRKLKIADK